MKKTKFTNKILSGVLALCMMSIVPTSAFATEGAKPDDTEVITAIAPLQPAEQEITVGSEVIPALPTELSATLTTTTWKEVQPTEGENATPSNSTEWQNETTTADIPVAVEWTLPEGEAFSTAEEKNFIYTASLKDGSYTVADDVTMPTFTVNVVKTNAPVNVPPSPRNTPAVGSTFIANIPNNGNAIDMQFRIVDLPSEGANGKVSVYGYYGNYAIDENYSGGIVIPSTVESGDVTYDVTLIESTAFLYCALTSVTIPDSVTSIGQQAFYRCISLQTVTINSESLLNSIGSNAFAYSGLTSIYIPNGVASIMNAVFSNCTNLSSVVFSDNSSLTSIGENAFYNSGLTSISIPDKVISIGVNAFNDCTNLSSVLFTENSNLNSIGNSAFVGCTKLTSITIPQGAYNASAFDSATDVKYHIFNDNYAFADGVLTVKTDAGVTEWKSNDSIGQGAVKSVVIVEGVTSIGDDAFNNCVNLETVTIPDSITSIGKSAFRDCTALKSIDIPNGITSIGENAFYNSGLISISIPDKVISIEDRAFARCNSLSSVDFIDNSSLTSIGIEAFRDCTALKSIDIPNGITSIGEAAFYNSGLTSISIPDKVISIEDRAFASCNSLSSVDFSDNSSLTSIGEYAFYNSGLTSISIPDKVISIEDNAFARCNSLSSVDFSDNSSLTSIGIDAFSYSGLTTISIPDSVTSIGQRAFADCTSLHTVKINPESLLDTIGIFAFYNSGLTSISIPDKVISIKEQAFDGCDSLQSIYFDGNYPAINVGISSIRDEATKYYNSTATGWEDKGATPIEINAYYTGANPTIAVKVGDADYTEFTTENGSGDTNAGDTYTVTVKGADNLFTTTRELTIQKSGTTFAPDNVKTYNGSNEADTFAYGDTITVKFTPKATGTAPASFKAKSLADNASSKTAELWLGETQLATVNASGNQEVTFTVDTTVVANFPYALFDGTTAHTLIVKWGGDDNLTASEGTVNVTLTPKTVGDFHIIGGVQDTDYEVIPATDSASETLKIKTDTPLIISNVDPNTPTQTVIRIDAGGTDTANVTLRDVNINNTAGYGELGMLVHSNATITMEGENKILAAVGGVELGYPFDVTIKGTGSLHSNVIIVDGKLTVSPTVISEGTSISGFRVDTENVGNKCYYGELSKAITAGTTIVVESGTEKSLGRWNSATIPDTHTLQIENGAKLTLVFGPKLTNNGTINNEGTITVHGYTYDENDPISTLDTSGGQYTGNAPTLISGGIFVKMANNLASVTLDDWTYGDTAKTPSESYGSKTQNGGDVVFEYKLTSANDGTYTTTAPKNVGSYTVRATSAETALTQAGEKTATFVITQKSLANTMIADIPDVEYTGSAIKPTLTVTDGTPSIIQASDYEVSYEENTDVGTATAKITATADGNYSGTASKTFEITKPSIATGVVTLGVNDFTYTGQSQTPTVTVTLNGSTVAASEYDISYSNSNGGANNTTNAGTITVTVTAKADGNYSGTVTQKPTYEIKKAEQIGFAITAVTGKKYGDSTFTLETTGGNGSGDVSYTVTAGNAITISGSTATIESAGTVTVTATKAESDNYNAATATTSITIAKADAPTLTFPTATSALTYGQKLSESTLFKTSDEYGTYEWTNGDAMPTVTNNGYEVTFTQTNENYEDVAVTTENVAVTVNPKEITVKAEDKTVITGKAMPTFSYTVTPSLLTGDSFTTEPSLATTATDTNTVGSFEISASNAVISNNYSITYEKGTLYVTVDTTALKTAVTNAENAKKDITVDDGTPSTVLSGIKFVPTAVMTAFETAITQAESVVSTATTEKEVADAIKALETAQKTFEDAIKIGIFKDTQVLKFSKSELTATMGTAFTEPTLTGDKTTVSYRSTNEDVATVDTKTGKVTLLEPGTTTIVVEAVETTQYHSAQAQYSLKVEEKAPTTFDEIKEFIASFDVDFAEVAKVIFNNVELKLTKIDENTYELSGYPSGDTVVIGRAVRGSVVVTLNEDFLKTLPAGSYSLSVTTLETPQTPVATLSVTVPQATTPTPTVAPTPTPKPTTPPETPKTGDDFNPALWISIAVISLGAITFFVRKKLVK